MSEVLAIRGSVGGAASDAGNEYRRGVAAYAVACGLSGVTLSGLSIPQTEACVSAVSLETDDHVDDIRIDFESGWRVFIQAKRTIDSGPTFQKAVAQWVKKAKFGLDSDTERLVIAAGNLSGPMKALKNLLDRLRTDSPGSSTEFEKNILRKLMDQLVDLDDDQRALVLKCAVIWELRVEEPYDPGSQQAIAHLRHVVHEIEHEAALIAWKTLVMLAGRVARLRGGYNLAGWLKALVGEGTEIGTAGATPAACLERQRHALERYRKRLILDGSTLDLRSLGAEIPPMLINEADAGVKVGVGPLKKDAHHDLLWAFLRRGKAVLTGLPGGGKSTALRQLAMQLASDESLPLPVIVSLRDVNNVSSALGFRDRLINVALRDERPDDREVLGAEISDRLEDNRGIALLLDSLDETYDQRGKVVGEIEKLVLGLPKGVCVLLATRDIAYGQAATLGWSGMRLAPPSNTMATVQAIL